MIPRILRRLRILSQKERIEEEMSEEMQFHLDMEIEGNLAKGMTPEAARRTALMAFGGVERFKEKGRDQRGGRLPDDLIQDTKLAFRKLLRAPGFAAVILLTLGLGIGANTAIFSVVNGILLRPLPYPSPDRLVRVFQVAPERGVNRGSFSLLDGQDWIQRSTNLTSLGLYSTLPGGLVYTGSNEARLVETAYVTAGFFETLGMAPLHGQILPPEEEYGDNRLLVFSHDYWQREHGGDQGVVGSSMDMEGQVYRVVGVMPPAFAFPSPGVDVWTFLTVIDEESIPIQNRGVRFLNAIGRMRPEVSREETVAELTSVARGLEEELPESNAGLSQADIVPLQDFMVGDVKLALLVLLGAVGFILIIACANVANLLMARGVGRSQEMALRSALGAARPRLVRQLLTESLVLGLVGGAVGILLSLWGVDLLVGGNAGLLPRAWEVEVQGEVLFFGLGISVLTGLIFGILPALTGSRVGLGQDLKEGQDRGTTTFGQNPLSQGLVVAQVSVAVVLLVGAGLMIRSLHRLQDVDAGFQPDGLLAASLIISDIRFTERDEYMDVYHQLLEGYRNIPEVEGVGVIRHLPFQGSGETLGYSVPGEAPPPAGQERRAWMLQVNEDLFQVMGIPLLAGRSFSPDDPPAGPMVVVINNTLAETVFPGGEAVGRVLRLAAGDLEAEVIGVVGDVHQESLRDPPRPTVYVYQEQLPRIGMTFVLRTAGDPMSFAAEARRVVREVDPSLPLTSVNSVEEVVAGSTAREGFFAFLLGAFALLAFLLAAVGIYGVVAHRVAKQLNEVGIRMALGAGPLDASRLILWRGLAPVVPGLFLGIVLAFGLTRFMRGMLFDVAPGDPLSYLAGLVLLAGAAIAATLIPATRAMRVDPARLLRHE
jgi:predicted permease